MINRVSFVSLLRWLVHTTPLDSCPQESRGYRKHCIAQNQRFVPSNSQQLKGSGTFHSDGMAGIARVWSGELTSHARPWLATPGQPRSFYAHLRKTCHATPFPSAWATRAHPLNNQMAAQAALIKHCATRLILNTI